MPTWAPHERAVGRAEESGILGTPSPTPVVPCQGELASLAAESQHFSFQSLRFFPSAPPRRKPLLLSTQPLILLSDLSREVSVVTVCVRITPLRVITLNPPLKDSSLRSPRAHTPLHGDARCACRCHPAASLSIPFQCPGGEPSGWQDRGAGQGAVEGQGVRKGGLWRDHTGSWGVAAEQEQWQERAPLPPALPAPRYSRLPLRGCLRAPSPVHQSGGTPGRQEPTAGRSGRGPGENKAPPVQRGLHLALHSPLQGGGQARPRPSRSNLSFGTGTGAGPALARSTPGRPLESRGVTHPRQTAKRKSAGLAISMHFDNNKLCF